MPIELERRLRREVNAKHPEWSAERKDRYVYGTMRKMGWRPKKSRIRRKTHAR